MITVDSDISQKLETPAAYTPASLATALGVSRQRVSALWKKAGAPSLSDLGGWRRYLDSKSRNGALEPTMATKIAAQNLRIKKAQAELLEFKQRVQSGELVELSEIRKVSGEVFSLLFGEHDRLQNTLPALLKGRSELEIFGVLKEEFSKIEEGLRVRLKGMLTS